LDYFLTKFYNIMGKKLRQRSIIEGELPSRCVPSCSGEFMNVSGSFSISDESINVVVETTVYGESDSESYYGKTFREVLAELAGSNYGPGAFVDALRALPDWKKVLARINQEDEAAELQSKQVRVIEAEKRISEQAYFGQVVSSSQDGRYQMGWRRIWSSNRAIRVVVLVDGIEHIVGGLFGSQPVSVNFDDQVSEFQGQIELPIEASQSSKALREFKLHCFRVGVEPVELLSLNIC